MPRVAVRQAAGVCATLFLIAAPSAAQSLADVARQEEARRNAIATPSKTFTNTNLTVDFTTPLAPVNATPLAPATPPSPVAGNTSPTAPAAAPASPNAEIPDEQVWRRRAADLRDRVAKARQSVERLSRAEVNPDPREQARTAALLKTAQDMLDRSEQQQQLFLQQADAARVPKAWVEPQP